MKKIHFKIVSLCFLFMGTAIFAQQKNAAPVDSEFLLKAFNSRMIATNDAKLAVKKGTTAKVRAFGSQMVRDQNQMYAVIKQLGAKRNMVFPKSIDYLDTKGRTKLLPLKGINFDRQYANQVTLDIQQDINLFRQASTSNNKEISDFAKEFLPLLESQLIAVKAL